MEKNKDGFEELYNRIWDALDVNHGALMEESFKHPRIALYWHAVGARAREAVETLEYQLTVLEAKLREEFRKRKEREKGKKLKPRDITKEMLDTYTTLHPDARKLRQKLIKARAIQDLLDGARWRLRERFNAIEDQRSTRGEEADQLTRFHRDYTEGGNAQ